jgi:hypothetical protein
VRLATQNLERARADLTAATKKAQEAAGVERKQKSLLSKASKKVDKRSREFEQALIKANNSRKFDSPRVAMSEFQRLRSQANMATLDGLAEKTNLVVPQATADSINRALNSVRRITNDVGELGRVMYFVQRFTSSWKALALLTPGYISRNAQSDALFSWLAGGRDPRSWLLGAKAMQVRTAMDKGVANKYTEEVIKIQGEELTVQQLVKQAMEDQAIGLSQTRGELLGQARKRAGQTFAPLGSGKVARTFQGANEWREDWTKFGLYIDLRKQGMSRIEAAERVRDFLFDYGEVSTFVAETRRFMLPFITWAAKAYPRTLKSVAENPGFFANVNAFEQAMNRDYGSDIDFSTLPVGREQAFALPGGEGNDRLLLDPGNVAPYTVLNSFNPNSIKTTSRSIGAFLNPLIKTPIEIGTGYSLFQGRQAPERVVAPPAVSWLGKAGINIPTLDFGPKKDLYTGQETMGYSRAWDSVLRILPLYSQVQSATAGIPGFSANTDRIGSIRFATGLNVVPFDRAKALYFAQKDDDRNRQESR